MKEILQQYLDLSESDLTSLEKEEVMDLAITYKEAFSFKR